MKIYRRIEITAFCRRVTIVASGEAAEKLSADVCINDADAQTPIDPRSAEGRRILAEAARLLEERLSDKPRGES